MNPKKYKGDRNIKLLNQKKSVSKKVVETKYADFSSSEPLFKV